MQPQVSLTPYWGGNQLCNTICNVPDHAAVAVEDLDAAPGVPHSVLGREPPARQVFLIDRWREINNNGGFASLLSKSTGNIYTMTGKKRSQTQARNYFVCSAATATTDFHNATTLKKVLVFKISTMSKKIYRKKK